MTKKKTKQLREAKDFVMAGALTMQSTQLLTRPRTIHNLTDTATGFVGIGVAGAVANVAFDMATGDNRFIIKKRKKKRR